jgi:hypothetical protein
MVAPISSYTLLLPSLTYDTPCKIEKCLFVSQMQVRIPRFPILPALAFNFFFSFQGSSYTHHLPNDTLERC